MRNFTATLLTIGSITIFSSACNDRAEMGHGPQRRSGGNNIIPAGFTNNVTPDDFRARTRQLALSDSARGLTLSPALESALQLAGIPAEQDTNSWGAFPAACPTLSDLTGSTLTAGQIRELSLQTSFALVRGDLSEAGCSDVINATGIEVFRTLNAVRYLADTMSSIEALNQDCVAMLPRPAGRQHALAWKLGPGTGDAWLTDHQVSQVEGDVAGGGRGGQTALSAWANLSGSSQQGRQQIVSSVNAFIDEEAGVTSIEKIGQYTQGAETLLQNTRISYDVKLGTLTETSLYESRKDAAVTSKRTIVANIRRAESDLTLTLADTPDTAGTDATVEFSLDAAQALHCTVK